MIDWDRIENLLAEVGQDDFRDVLELFMEEVEAAITRLANASDTSADPAHLEQELHFLNGCALNLGFTRLADLCGRGERDAAAGRQAEVDIPAITDCFRASRADFIARGTYLGIGGL